MYFEVGTWTGRPVDVGSIPTESLDKRLDRARNDD